MKAALILTLSWCLLAFAQLRVFDAYDTDKDGMLSRAEFKQYSLNFQESIHEYVDDSPDVVTSPNKIAPPKSWIFFSRFIDTDDTVFWSAVLNSFLMILVTELGDKTFFIAAILAMQHPRLTVFVGAFSAVGLMHILSSIMGFALPAILPREYTHFISGFLFLYFGVKLLREVASKKSSGPSDELGEVEDELLLKNNDLEGNNFKNVTSMISTAGSIAVLTNAFTLTFLAEWGDRSQIATLAMSTSTNPIGVALGGLFGHMVCTGIAVVGGRLLAQKISERTVCIIGGVLFLVFGVHSLFFSNGNAM